MNGVILLMDNGNSNPDYRYFNGADSFLDDSYFSKKLVKKRFRLEYEKGENIIEAGDTVDDCFYIKSGSVIAYEIIKGKRKIFDHYSAGSFLLCEHILFEHPCTYYYEAREKTVVYSISMTKVRQLVVNDRRFLQSLFAQQTRNLLVREDLLRKSTSHNASWLVCDFLITMVLRNGQTEDGIVYLVERLTQKQIADMLFMNRVTCFRELHTLEDIGLIDMQTSRIGIKSLSGLIAYKEKCEENK